RIAPVVDTKMSDSAVVHFYLYRHSRLIDRFGNATLLFQAFDADEAVLFQGRPELWADLLANPNLVNNLRQAWQPARGADEIVTLTSHLFGWNRHLEYVGYTFDDEGIPMKYTELLCHSEIALDAFDEYHYEEEASAEPER